MPAKRAKALKEGLDPRVQQAIEDMKTIHVESDSLRIDDLNLPDFATMLLQQGKGRTSSDHDMAADTNAPIVPRPKATAELPIVLPTPDGNYIRVSLPTYFSTEWVDKIRSLDRLIPFDDPKVFFMRLYDHQRQAAAMAYYCCMSAVRGFMLGDAPGVGKTQSSIRVIHQFNEIPAAWCLIICPKSCVDQWNREIAATYKEGFGPRTVLLDDPAVTALDLAASKAKIVITSYGFVERSYSKMLEAQSYHSNDPSFNKRSESALYSDYWSFIKRPLGLVVLDEAQNIKHWQGKRYIAVKALKCHSRLIVSGTIDHNTWMDIGPLTLLLKDHPIDSMATFMNVFGTLNKDTNQHELNKEVIPYLQVFLSRFTIIRPSSILELPCEQYITDIRFKLNILDEQEVKYQMKAYRLAMAAHKREAKKDKRSTTYAYCPDAPKAVYTFLAKAIRASQHRLMNLIEYLDDDDLIGKSLKPEKRSTQEKTWQDTLKTLAAKDLMSSERVTEFFKLVEDVWIRHPGESMIVFSQSKRFLDILDSVYVKEHNIEPLRFDSTVSKSKREEVRFRFNKSRPKVPLLMTAGSGGTGLNIPKASIVIQTEPWWNPNAEIQAWARAYRQGQKKDVHVYKLISSSEIDNMICNSQLRKNEIRSELMGPMKSIPGTPRSLPTLPKLR